MKCKRGCTTSNHTPACTCTPECPDHEGHCKGCLPAEAAVGELCTHCLNRTRTALDSIPELVALVAARNDGKLNTPRTETDNTRRAAHAHAPSLSPAWDAAEEVFQWALRTALACADENRHHGPFQYRRDGVPARNTTQLIRYIRANLDWYAADIPEDIHDEATGFHRALIRLSGTDRLMHRIKEPCPSCDRRTLTREDGSDSVICRNAECGRIWREGEYEHLAHVAVS